MAITSSTVFDELRVNIQDIDGLDVISYKLYSNGVFVDTVPFPNRRLDESDPEVMIVVAACRAGTCLTTYTGSTDSPTPLTVRQLRERNLWAAFVHPFHPMDGYLYRKAFIRHAEITEDPVTGRVDLEHEFGSVSRSRRPDSGVYAYPLDEWIARPRHTTLQFSLRIDLTSNGVTDANIENQEPVRALKEWLRNTARFNGDDPGADADLFYNSDPDYSYPYEFNSRHFRFMQGDPLVNVDAYIIGTHSVQIGGEYSYVEVDFSRVSTTPQNIDELNAWIQTQVGQLTLSATEKPEHPPFGPADGGPVTAGAVHLPHNKIREVNGRVVIEGTDHLGTRFMIPLEGGYGRTIDYSACEVYGDPADGVRLAPLHHSTVEFADNVDRSLRLRSAREMVVAAGTDRILHIKNVSSSGECFILHPVTGAIIFTFKPGESGSLQIELRRNGAGQITNVGTLPTRHQIISSGIQREGGVVGGELDTTRYLVADAANYFRFIPTPTFVDSEHVDAFANGTSNITNGQDLRTYTGPWDVPWAVRLLQGGLLTIEYEIDLRTLTAFSGEFDCYMQLFKVPGGNEGAVPFGRNEFQDIAGVGTGRRLHIAEQKDVLPNDVVFAGIVYPIGTTAQIGEIQVENFDRRLALETLIAINA